MLQIDYTSRKPIYDQLIEQIERFIMAGVYPAGTRLPSVRSLSCQLSVNPNTIQKAYALLCERGLTCPVAGKGCFVSEAAAELLQKKARERLPEFTRLAAELLSAGLSAGELKGCIDAALDERSEQA